MILNPGELTQRYVTLLEKAIRKKPANYLWSHRRWKWEFNAEKHHAVTSKAGTLKAITCEVKNKNCLRCINVQAA
jgi:hypothetical protein